MTALTLVDKTLILHCPYEQKEVAKSIYGARWSKKLKGWQYPLQVEVFEEIKALFHDLIVDQKVKDSIQKILDSQSQIAGLKNEGWQDAVPVEPMPLKTKPFQHQVLGYNIGLKIPNAALLMEQGTGKSLTAVAIAGRRFERGEVRKILVVAPASVVPVWSREFTTHSSVPHVVVPLTGKVTHRVEKLDAIQDIMDADDKLFIATVNYEATWRMEEALTKWKPDMIICDEAQRIKTPGARQSQSLHRLGAKTPYKLILTGTPVTQSPLDFFSQYKFLDPMIFGGSYYAFKNRYAIMGGYGNYSIIGYRNLPELVKKAHSVAFRVTKEEALDLPEAIDQELYCDLEDKALKIYKEMKKDSVAHLSEEKILAAPNVLSRLLRLCQLTGGYLGDGEGSVHLVSKSKLLLLGETLSDVLVAGKKVVIFARFIPEINAIKTLLDKANIGYAFITGDVPMEKRGQEVERFQSDNDCRVFIAQIQTAGLGITLTAADTTIFYSLDFSYANYDQCRARTHRIGQKNTCTYIHLIAKDTVDEKILQALKHKGDVAKDVVDNWRNYFGE